jgi:ankyrin repeat protein
MTSDIEKAFGAVRSGDVGLLEGLLAANPSLAASRGENGVSLTLTACYFRRGEMVDFLIARVGSLDIFEASAVERATARVAALLDEDSSLTGAFSTDGFTPLHLACYFGRADTARVLLERAADPNVVSRNPMSLRPLHSASVSRSMHIVTLLVDRGADVNARQHGGWTALHAAAFNGDLPMAEYLVAHGADASVKSDDGKTPLDAAAEKGHASVVDWLASQETPG